MSLSFMIRPGRLWWLARRDLKRGPTASWHAHVTARRILSDCRPLPAAKASNNGPTVHLLTGEEQWLMSTWMIASWLHFTERAWNIHLHDDGTLTDASATELSRLFPGIRILRRQEADEIMEPILAQSPLCATYRAQHPLGIKAFDIPHLATGDRFILLDSDVLFFRRPTELLEWADDPSNRDSWFNQDPLEPSPLSHDACRQSLGFELWPRVNSGLCLLQKNSCDLDQFEQWISLPAIREGKAWRREQTLFALGASRTNRGGVLPSTYEVSLGSARDANSISRHYVGAVRDQFYAEGVGTLRQVLLKASK